MARRRRHRTMTPAALAANRRNLEKARAARSRAAAQKAPTKLAIRKAPISSNKTQIKAASQKALSTKAIEGKKPTAKVGEEMVTLYHRTTPAAAKKIVKEGFSRDAKNAITGGTYAGNDTTQYVYFSTSRTGVSKDYGLALVSIKVPKKMVKPDPEPPGYDSPKSHDWFMVKSSDLKTLTSKPRASGLNNPNGTGWYSFMTPAQKRKKMAAYRAKHPVRRRRGKNAKT